MLYNEVGLIHFIFFNLFVVVGVVIYRKCFLVFVLRFTVHTFRDWLN